MVDRPVYAVYEAIGQVTIVLKVSVAYLYAFSFNVNYYF